MLRVSTWVGPPADMGLKRGTKPRPTNTQRGTPGPPICIVIILGYTAGSTSQNCIPRLCVKPQQPISPCETVRIPSLTMRVSFLHIVIMVMSSLTVNYVSPRLHSTAAGTENATDRVIREQMPCYVVVRCVLLQKIVRSMLKSSCE